jgi:uncharacterized protein (DUF1330 family)
VQALLPWQQRRYGHVVPRPGARLPAPPALWHDGVMTAYWVSVYKEIVDEGKLAAYSELAGPALRAGGGTLLARGLPEQTYEAGEKVRVVLLQFESVEAARAAHDSPGYQAALAALDGGAIRDVRIVPGVE